MTSPRLPATTRARPLLCAATLLVLAGCASQGGDGASDTAAAPSTPASTRTTSSTDPDPDPAPASDRAQLISYEGGESGAAEVRTTADADNLSGAPDSFKTFIGRTAARLTGGDCESGDVGVTVRRLRTDGFAVGAVNDCGGYVALWAIVDGDWREIDATQDLWNCAALAAHRVPSDIAGDTCYDRNAQAQVPYEQA